MSQLFINCLWLITICCWNVLQSKCRTFTRAQTLFQKQTSNSYTFEAILLLATSDDYLFKINCFILKQNNEKLWLFNISSRYFTPHCIQREVMSNARIDLGLGQKCHDTTDNVADKSCVVLPRTFFSCKGKPLFIYRPKSCFLIILIINANFLWEFEKKCLL